MGVAEGSCAGSRVRRSPAGFRLGFVGGGLLFLLSCSGAEPLSTRLANLASEKIVDLTHSFEAETIYWPTEVDGFKLEKGAAGVTEKGYFYAANRMRLAEHGGTHIDAPYHFSETGRTVEEIPVQQLVGRGVVIDVTEKCNADRDYQIGVDDFTGWESRHGEIPSGAILLLRTGFGKSWPDRKGYLGTASFGAEAVEELHFPGLHPDAARWLISEREIKAIGLDTPSIDYGQSKMFQSHVDLFAANIPALENVAHLDRLPEVGFSLVVLPMKIEGGTGGPVRVVAFLD